VDDVRLSVRKGLVVVRSGKGETYREVPLNADVREALRMGLKERTRRFPQICEPALVLNLKGRRLSRRAIDLVLRQLGREAKGEVSAQVLRHTCLTNRRSVVAMTWCWRLRSRSINARNHSSLQVALDFRTVKALWRDDT
jgi:site-specific recombinase XerC